MDLDGTWLQSFAMRVASESVLRLELFERRHGPGNPMTARSGRRKSRSKTISAQGLTGQRGINAIERVVLEMGCRWTASGANEIGIDGYIELFDPSSHKPLGVTVAVQSKVVSSIARGSKDSFEYWCDPADVEYWLSGNTPVVLIVSAGNSNEAYWISVRTYFKDWKPAHLTTVSFDKKKHRFSADSFSDLVNVAAPKSGLYLAPTRRSEVLRTNLLHLHACPPTIFSAETACRRPPDVWATLRTAEGARDAAWMLWEGKIFSFHDLGKSPWSSVCERGTLEEFPTNDWAVSADLQLRHVFVQLLNRTLKAQLDPDVKFWPQEDCFALMGKPGKESYESVKRSSRLTVISQFSSTTKDGRKFVWFRHLAFQGQFRLFSGLWYLEITPTYRFTTDGYNLDRFHEERLSGIKRLEGNRAVLSSVMFWAQYLRPRSGLFRKPRPLEFGELLSFRTDVGIVDKTWLSSEPVSPPKISVFDGQSSLDGEADGTEL